MNSSIPGAVRNGDFFFAVKAMKAVPLATDSKCKGVAPKLGTCDAKANLIMTERTLTMCLGWHATKI